jgi:hypothetical protein
MKSGDEIKVTLPGNMFLVAEYRRTDMWGNIEAYFSGTMSTYLSAQLQAVAVYYLRTDYGVSFSIDQGRVIPLESSKEKRINEKCECGTEAVGGTRHQHYCPKYASVLQV